MSWFVEDSRPFLVIGVTIEAILLVALVRTGRGMLLYFMAGIAIFVGAIVFIEMHTVTDTKRVKSTLQGAADALEKNQLPELLAFISSASPKGIGMRNQISSILPTIEVHEAHIGDLKIKVNRFNNPPSATAEFLGRLNASDRRGMMPYQNYIQRFKVTLRLEGDRWLMENYEEIRPGDVGPDNGK